MNNDFLKNIEFVVDQFSYLTPKIRVFTDRAVCFDHLRPCLMWVKMRAHI